MNLGMKFSRIYYVVGLPDSFEVTEITYFKVSVVYPAVHYTLSVFMKGRSG